MEEEQPPKPNVKQNKQKRCPAGTRKNMKTNACEPIDAQKVAKHRCPPGTRKHPKTGVCEEVKKKSNNGQTPVSTPPSSSPKSPVVPFEETIVYNPDDLNDKDILEELEKQLSAPIPTVKPQRKKKQQKPVVEPILPTLPATEAENVLPDVASIQPIVQDKTKAKEVVAPDNTNEMNQFLREKEKMERASLPNYSFLYPELNDPLFNVKIASRKEFHDTKYDGTVYDIEKRANEMCEAKFELLPHQLFVKNFLSFQTPYNSLLLYHSLGTGKTCSAIGIAEEMRGYMKQAGIRDKIMVVASPNLQGNFRKQLFDERALKQIVNPNNPEEYTWNMESCVGNTLLNEINPNGITKNIPREKIVSNINTIINHYYEFMGYGQLANYINDLLKVDLQSGFSEQEMRAIEIRNIRRAFNNKLVIIDEVHNIRLTDDNNNKTVAALLMKVAKYAVNMRLLLLSATPMFNSYNEIIWLTNLMNLNDKRSTIELREVFDKEGNYKPATGKRSETGKELLIRKLTGYVSYVRGENPYVFPFRVYPKHFAPEQTFAMHTYPTIQMNGKPITEPLKHVDVFVNITQPDTYQMNAYHFLLKYFKQRNFDVLERETGELLREMPGFEEMDAFGYALLQTPMEALNITYPNPQFDELIARGQTQPDLDLGMHKDIFQSVVGEKGLNSVMKYSEIHKPNMIKGDFEYLPETLKKYGRIFAPQNIAKYSQKIANICDHIKQSKGLCIVYSQYIDGGIIPMCLALEEMGFTRFGAAPWTQSLFKKAPTEQIDAITMKPRSQLDPQTTFHAAKYVIISGDKYYSPNNKDDMKAITAPDNMDGRNVKVVFITKAGSEGLDFKNIRQIHILEPWYNMNRMEQIIGRGVRNLSHCSLPFTERNVQIYMHATLIENSNEEAADLYVYRLAEMKAMKIGKVTRLLKETAVDCILNVGQTNFTSEKLEAVETNRNVQLKLSNGQTIQYRVGDQPFTDICDYMDTCEIKCTPTAEITEPNLVLEMYNNEFAQTNLQYISNRIKQLYREQHVYTRDHIIKAVNWKKSFPVEQIYMALSSFINNKYNYLLDKYGRFGYLVNVDIYYLFQPIELTNAQATAFERSIPIPYRRDKVSLEVPVTTGQLIATIDTEPKSQTVMEEVVAPEKPKQQTEVVLPDVGMRTYKEIVEMVIEKVELTTSPKSLKNTIDWYKHFHYIREHLSTNYGIDDQTITMYVVYHILDMLEYQDKMVLLRTVFLNQPHQIDKLIEKWIHNYFTEKLMVNETKQVWGVLVCNFDKIELWMRNLSEPASEWSIGNTYDYDLFVDDYVRIVSDKTRLFHIVGFTIDFKHKEMVYKVKDMRQKRNNNGARLDSAGKADILKILNEVVGEEKYTTENADKITKIGLCGILEVLMREYTSTKKRNLVYHLSPEQTLVIDIVHL